MQSAVDRSTCEAVDHVEAVGVDDLIQRFKVAWTDSEKVLVTKVAGSTGNDKTQAMNSCPESEHIAHQEFESGVRKHGWTVARFFLVQCGVGKHAMEQAGCLDARIECDHAKA